MPRPMDVFEELVEVRRRGHKAALCTIVEVEGSIPSFQSAKMLIREDGSMVGTIGGGCTEAEVWNAAREVMETEKPRMLSFRLNQEAAYDNGLICGGQLNVYVEPVLPIPTAYIFGGGHISKSLSKVASLAGFRTAVIDDREQYANAERFPEAFEVYADDYENVFPKLEVSSATYLIIVTRGHRDDMRVLRWAVQTEARYVAMIGSKRKTIEVAKQLVREGVPAEKLVRVHAPMGFDIGAVTPEEIAVSVVAEMIHHRRRPQAGWSELSKSIFREGLPKP
ncbi:MAG: XdhC/CoxI family protein [Bryobacterales bacterium]